MKFTTTNVKIPVKNQHLDGTLYVPEDGEGRLPGVVIFHGRGSQKTRYTDRAEELARAGFITLVFSFRGCGESDGDFKNQTPAMGYEDALAGYDFLISDLRVDRDHIGVWGGSFGGYMATLITKDRPVHSLILAAPAIYKNEWWNTVLESLPEDENQGYRDGKDFSDNNAINAIENYVGSVLLVRHEQDNVCPVHQTQYYLNHAKKAFVKEERKIKGLGHRLVEENHRVESNKITVDWFQRTLVDKSKLAVSTYEKIAGIYTKQYFNDLTDTPYIDKFLEKLPKGASILDVGSGPGQFTKYMMDKGYVVAGVDFSEEMLASAKKMVPEGNFQQADMRNLNFQDAEFDGLLVAYSLIHIPSEGILKTLQGFYRLLKPGGYIEIIAQKGEADKVIDEPFMPTEKMFFNFFTKERLAKFLQEAGFEIDYQLETKSQDPDSASDKVICTIARK